MEKSRLEQEQEFENSETAKSLTKAYLKWLLGSRPRDYYTTPALNGTLYLQRKGLSRIENLEEFTGLKVLYVDGNAISRIENVECLTQLSQLFLNENLIEKIENLFTLQQLSYLNLSDNLITTIPSQLQELKSLETLLLKGNRLTYGGCLNLQLLTSVSSLDLSNNGIEYATAGGSAEESNFVDEVLLKMPALQVLYLQNNPLTKNVKSYRKSVLSRMTALKHLDELPVNAEEKRYVAAWRQGGLEAERAERAKVKEEQLQWHREYLTRNPEALEKVRNQIRELARRREAAASLNSSVSDVGRS